MTEQQKQNEIDEAASVLIENSEDAAAPAGAVFSGGGSLRRSAAGSFGNSKSRILSFWQS